jgi:tetratricopeptide (TPR) repeat protein
VYRTWIWILALSLFPTQLKSQVTSSEQVQIAPPTAQRIEPPSPNASATELENRGDELRGEKYFLDALDYYNAALDKEPRSYHLWNKAGMAELSVQHYRESQKDFERAFKIDHTFADAYNNLGVIYYIAKKYGKAIKLYKKAIKINPAFASYYNNLGAAYFSKKEWGNSSVAYTKAVELDPDIFERSSRTGVAAQLSSPEDRAHFQYVLAGIYAKAGESERALACLRRALEAGYKGIDDVYKDEEFAGLRKDPRFAQLMANRPMPVPE